MTVTQEGVNPEVPLRSSRGSLILAATIVGSGMVFMDGSVVSVALPVIQRDLAAPLAGLQWIIDAYALLLASLLLIGGALGDVYGRTRAYIAGLVIFTLSSLAAGLAPNLGILIAARAVQGIGGALLVPGSLAMIKAVIAPQDSGRAIGLWTGFSGVTVAIGPLVGGYLIHAISWRAVFFLNLPLCAVAIWLTIAYIPPNRDAGASRALDWLGSGISAIGLGGLSFGLIEGPERGWSDPLILGTLAIGVAALILFPIRDWRAPHPLVPLRLFRSRNFTGCNLVTLIIYFCFAGIPFFALVLDLQEVQGYTALQTGAALLPITVLLLVLSPLAGGLLSRTGARWPMTAGAALIALAYALLLLPGHHASYLLGFLPALVVQGIGMAIFITPLTATVMSAVPPEDVGVASGVNNAVARVGSVLAIALLGALLAIRFDAALADQLHHSPLPAAAGVSLQAHADRLAADPIPPSLDPAQQQQAQLAVQDAYTSAFRWVVATCALLCAIGALLSAALIRD